jgi:hypothetical protein
MFNSVDKTPTQAKASFLVRARGVQLNPRNQWVLAPFYDMYNHISGDKGNMKRMGKVGYGVEVWSTKDIRAGEQILVNYGKDTPLMLREFGFVENYPQQWKFDFTTAGGSVVTFSIDQVDGSKYTVDWSDKTGVPDEGTLEILRTELSRLRNLESKRSATWGDVPKTEHAIIWDYYDALKIALNEAIIRTENDYDNHDVPKDTCVPKAE